MNHPALTYRVALLGAPSRPDVPWSRENLERLKALGFNTMQLHLAWGARPGDEPLNLEDVVQLSDARITELGVTPMPARSDAAPERREQRRRQIRDRLALCKDLGLRTIFHFGAPFNAQYGGGMDANGPLPRCLSDPATTTYYVELLGAFAAEFPGVDDILVYTYDQDAWLCNEFGTCDACRGTPLHERVVPFVDALTAQWRAFSPEGRLWWSPWELSAGQVYRCVERLRSEGLGLDLHPNIAETMATLPVDRWLKNTCAMARERGIPVLVEGYFGATSEEIEPFQYLPHPQVTFRQARALAAVPGVCGLKEYYGLIPDKEDPNLRATGVFLTEPTIDEDAAMARVAEPYGDVAAQVVEFWRLASQGQEFFPWDTSWLIRSRGHSDVTHSLTAAFLRGAMCDTPSWCSTRRAIFMKVDSEQPHPWMLEDVELRCALSAERIAAALELGTRIRERVPENLRREFAKALEELAAFRRRALSFAHHLRETNLTMLMRDIRERGEVIPPRLVEELAAVLDEDLANQREAHDCLPLLPFGARWIWLPEGATAPVPWAPRVFRRTFEIGEARRVLCVASSSEAQVRLWVNGAPIEAFGDGVPPFCVDLTDHLRTGANTLAVRVPKATSNFAEPGFCLKLAIERSDGTGETLVTDARWRVLDRQPDGWQQPGFDDTSWPAAAEKADYGEGPWRTQGIGDGGKALAAVIEDLGRDLDTFLDTWFQIVPDGASKGIFTTTSR